MNSAKIPHPPNREKDYYMTGNKKFYLVNELPDFPLCHPLHSLFPPSVWPKNIPAVSGNDEQLH